MEKQDLQSYYLKDKVVVIDNGTGFTKMGYAGNKTPDFDIPTAISDTINKPSVQISKLHYDQLDFSIGYDIEKDRYSHNIIYPMKTGVITDWTLMEKFWHRSIYDYLKCQPEDTKFILTQPPLNPPQNRQQIAEIFFETFNVQGLHIAILSMISSGQNKSHLTGTVIDSGDGVTHIIPIADGFVIGSCIKHIPLAGSDITKFIRDMIKDRGEKLPIQELTKVAKKVKEKYGYVVQNDNLIEQIQKFDIRKDNGLSKKFKNIEGQHPLTKQKYKVTVGYQRFLGPEMFFHPQFHDLKWKSPIDQQIDKAIQFSPIEYRRQLYNNIVTSGGSTLFQGFGLRLQSELQKRVDKRLQKYQLVSKVKPTHIKVKVNLNPYGRYSVWQGGSLLALCKQFDKLYKSREQYFEIGPRIARYNAAYIQN